MQAASIVFQAPNRVGLGHMSRLSSIAAEVRLLEPSSRLAFIVEGSSHGFPEALGFPCLSFPHSASLFQDRHWSGWNLRQRQDLMLKLACAVVEELRPDCILFDTIVLMPLAIVAAHKGVTTGVCLRKRKPMAAFLKAFEREAERFSFFLFPHDPGEFDVPASMAGRSHFVGRTVRKPVPHPDQDLLPAHPLVISGGGGGFPGTVDFYNTALEAADRVRRDRPDVPIILVAGPLFEDWARLRLPAGVIVIPFERNMPALLARARLVICQAGYNTLSEICSVAARAICVPASRAYDDQHERASAWAAWNRELVTLDAPDVNTLALAIHRSLDTPGCAPAAFVDSGGSARAAALVLSACRQPVPARAGA